MFIFIIFLGFPIAFTLMAMGVGFGYYAYFDPSRMWRAYNRAVEAGADSWTLTETLDRRVLQQPHLRPVRQPDLLGHVERRADRRSRSSCSWATSSSAPTSSSRLFRTLQIAAQRIPGSLAVAALVTCALFATATGIVGAVVTLMGLLAFPAMLKARYDDQLRLRHHLRRRHARHPDPAVDHADRLRRGRRASRSCASMPARCFPGFLLAGLYLVYVIVRAWLQPSIAPQADRRRTIGDITVGQLVVMLLTSFLPARLADPRGARRDPVRPRDAVGGGGDRRARRPRPRCRLPRADLAAAARVRLPDGPHHGDGVLALRRLVRPSRRSSPISAASS